MGPLRRLRRPPSKTPVRTTGPKSTLAHKVQPKPPPVVLSDKDFRAYELSYNDGATLVLTAKATVGPNNAGVTQEKYVTIIAQPDFNGDPQVRLQSVTDAKHLDITPRMKLVDAVDTDGDNRAELIFELMRTSDRQFAIYKIKGPHAEQAFATESLPYVTPRPRGRDQQQLMRPASLGGAGPQLSLASLMRGWLRLFSAAISRFGMALSALRCGQSPAPAPCRLFPPMGGL